MRTKRHMGEAEQLAFLAEAGELRKVCVAALAKAPINAPFYRSVSGLLDAIDGVAEVVTGDRRHFFLKPHSTP